MYKGKKVILTTTACKRINLLKAAIQSFGIFCQDKNIIDEIHYYDDSSQPHERSTAIEYYHKHIPSAKMIEVNMERAEAERWLGRKPHRWASLYNENVSDWYMHHFDPKLYKQP